jgi:hypothetical protein
MDLMHLAQDRDQWQAHVNTVINLGFQKRQGVSWGGDYYLLKKDCAT